MLQIDADRYLSKSPISRIFVSSFVIQTALGLTLSRL